MRQYIYHIKVRSPSPSTLEWTDVFGTISAHNKFTGGENTGKRKW